MRAFVIAAFAAFSIMSAMPADAQHAMPRSNPAELPKVFAVRISVADLARSEHFYRDGLGATVHQIHAGESSISFVTGPSVVIAQAAVGSATHGGPAGFILQVFDIDAALAHVAEAGGSVERPPNDGKAALSYGVRSAFIRDPDGVGIEVIQFPAAAAH